MSTRNVLTVRKTCLRGAALAALAVGLAACAIRPDISKRPDAPISPQFKENQGWKPATPSEAASGQPWVVDLIHDPARWSGKTDPTFPTRTSRRRKLPYRAAHAEVGVQRGALFPTIGVGATGQENRWARSKASLSGNGQSARSYTADATEELGP